MKEKTGQSRDFATTRLEGQANSLPGSFLKKQEVYLGLDMATKFDQDVSLPVWSRDLQPSLAAILNAQGISRVMAPQVPFLAVTLEVTH